MPALPDDAQKIEFSEQVAAATLRCVQSRKLGVEFVMAAGSKDPAVFSAW